jgi:hypothetical protein
VAFCVNPDCTCEEASLHAVEIDERFVEMRQAGRRLLVHFRPGGDRPLPNVSMSAHVLTALWDAYRQRHEPTELGERMRRMQRLRPEILELRASQLRRRPWRDGATRRSDPCPCGSGRSYGECCSRRAS